MSRALADASSETVTRASAATDPAHVAAQLERIMHALQADFVLISRLDHDTLVFPYHCGTLPPDVASFISRGRVNVNEHTLAAALVETGVAYYGEERFNAEGETTLENLELLIAVQPLKSPLGAVTGFVNVGRNPNLGPWTSIERTLLHRAAADLALILSDSGDSRHADPTLGDDPHFLKAVANAVPNLIYIYDFQTQQSRYVNDRLTPLLGYTLGDLEDLGEHFHFQAQLIHPQDLGKLGPWREQTTRLGDGETLEVEYRFRHKDTTWRWMLGRERVFARGEDGSIAQVIGTLEDITERKRTEEQLRLYEKVVLGTRDAVLITEAEPIDEPGPRIVYANQAFTDMTGYTPAEVLGQPPRLLQGPKTDRAQLDKIRTALEAWQPVRVELVNYRKDGSEFEVEFDITPVADERGWFTHWVSVQRDITDRKRRERSLAFTAALQQAVAPLRDPDDIMRTVGERVARYLGLAHCLIVQIDEAADEATVLYDHCSPDVPDLRGVYALRDFYTEDERQRLMSGHVVTIDDVRDGQRSSVAAAGFEALFIRPLVTAPYVSDGRWTFALSGQRADVHRWREDERALLVEVALWLYPRLERARTEQALASSEQRLKLGINVTRFALAEIDYLAGTITLSAEAAQLYGLGETEVVVPRERVHATFHPEDRGWLAAWIAEVIDPGGTGEMNCEHRVILPDGTLRWLNVRKQIFFDRQADTPHPTRGILVAQDITERKRDEERLRLLESVVLNTSDTVMITDAGQVDPPGPRIVYVNKAFTDMTGYAPEEVLGRTPRFLQGPKTDRAQLAQIRAALETRQPQRVEVTNYRKDGEAFQVEFEVVPVENASGAVTHWVSVQRDVTERKRVEDSLRVSHERMRLAMEATKLGHWEVNAATGQTSVSSNYAEVLGFPPDLLPENILTAIAALAAPDEAERLVTALRRTIAGAGDMQLEHRMIHPQTNETLWFETHARLLPEAADTPGQVLGTIRNITGRKRTEEALKEADRRKDEFLATLAHELRNPLAPIRMGIEIIKRSPDRSTREEAMSVIERQTDQIVRLVDDLLDVSRITNGTIHLHKEPITLDEVMTMALEAARPLMAEKNHQLLLNLPVRKVWLEGDKTRLCQVFLNLLTNATKYSPTGSEVSVAAELTGEGVVVRVRDTGIGLAPESLERVFDLFARVNTGEAAKQDGLGIGLNLVKRLVALHGGSIAVSSPGLGRGSTFSVKLPILEAQEGVPAVEPRETKSNVSRRVLVVDDYEANRKTLTRMLKLMGHEVTAAVDGREALEVLETFAPDLVLLDINMPGMSGYEVVRHIRENVAHEHLRVVALTGYGAEEDIRRAREAGFDHHLVKPVTMELLENVLRETVED